MAAVDDGVGAADAEARDDEAVAPSVAMLSRDMATSTRMGELRRAARRRSTRGEVGVSGLGLGERISMR